MAERTEEEKFILREKISKRVAGAVLVISGMILSMVLFFKCMEIKIADPDTAKSIINGLFTSGCVLLGVDVVQSLLGKDK